MNIIGNTDKGQVRKTNQDYFTNRVLSSNTVYSIVCDGMGGVHGGNVASKAATEFVEGFLNQKMDKAPDYKTVRGMLTAAVAGANEKVYTMAGETEELTGMGTTIIIAVVHERMLYGVNAGDSRLYIINRDSKEIRQVTRDHTVVQILLEKGTISKEEAANHPKKHYITRAVGVDSEIDVDYFEEELLANDVILICTDGLYNFCTDEEMYKKSMDSIQLGTVIPLIECANNNGGTDNITAVIISQFEGGIR